MKQEPKLRTYLREFIDKSMKEYPDLSSEFLYEYMLTAIASSHFDIFWQWAKKNNFILQKEKKDE